MEEERERERHLSSTDLLPRLLQWPVLGQAEGRSQALSLGLPCGWQGPKQLDYLLLLSQPVNSKLDRKWSNWDTNKHSYGVRALQSVALPAMLLHQPLGRTFDGKTHCPVAWASLAL